MLEAVASAFGQLASFEHLVFLVGGVSMGLVVGVFPGLGGIAGMSILLPFLYGMDPVSALAMLIGLVAVIPTSDTFTSVLMGIPGSSASQATVLDGFPLAKKGEGARALSAAFAASLFGGLVGALVLTLFILVARPVILLFGTAELFMLAVLGLSMVGVLAGRSLAKGMGTCGLGLLLGAVGAAPATGEYRMNFGMDYLIDGIPLVVIGLAIFAVPEIIDLLRRQRSISDRPTLGSGWIQGVKDMLANKWLVTRCAGIGCLVGALPGLGGSVVDWIAYGHVVQTSRDRENFGKGDIRGVLAPESANNAKEGGGLIPTILFGIPGSGSMAVFLGGLMLIGIDTGINMVEEDLDKTYVIIWSLAIANVIGAGACILLSKPIARLTTVPYVFLAPFMIMVITFAAFQATRSWGDILALFAIGAFAVYMKRFGWPRPPFLIGFVLAAPSEANLYQAIQFYDGWGWMTRPGVIIIAAITIASVWFGMRYASKADGSSMDTETGEGLPKSLRPQIAFTVIILLIFFFGFVDSLSHDFLGQIYPLSVSVVMIGFVLYVLSVKLRGVSDHPIVFDAEADYEYRDTPEAVSAEHYLLWLAGLLFMTYLVGFVLAMAAFFALFLMVKSEARPLTVAVLTASAVGFLAGMSKLLVLHFPAGLLQEAIEMPWPFQ